MHLIEMDDLRLGTVGNILVLRIQCVEFFLARFHLLLVFALLLFLLFGLVFRLLRGSNNGNIVGSRVRR
jgi:hypothetical protein